MAALPLISLLLIAGSWCSARLLENDLFISSANPSVFDPNVNSVADGHMEKDAVEYDQENSHWVSSSASSSKKYSKNEISELSFRLTPTIQNIEKADESPLWNKVKGVLNLMTKGAPSLHVNSMQMTGQQLSISGNSPGVGHMQMNPHKSQKRNVDIHHSNRDNKSKNLKRKRGDGH